MYQRKTWMQRSSSGNVAGAFVHRGQQIKRDEPQSSVSQFASREAEAEDALCDFFGCIKTSAWVEFLSALVSNLSPAKKWTAGLGTVCVQMHKCSLSLNSPKISQAHGYLCCKCYWSFAFSFCLCCDLVKWNQFQPSRLLSTKISS